MIRRPDEIGPAFDLQVNGYGGVDFNAPDLSIEYMERACCRLADDGVSGVLVAIVTAPLDTMCRRVERMARFIEESELVGRTVRGIHAEGPFISREAGFVGAHPPEHTRDAEVDLAERLLDAGGGYVRLVTLAPERDRGQAVTRKLADRGVAVSAGHTDASLDTLRAATDAGLSLFTHLGNGCPSRLPRHDNIIQRVLALSDRIRPCFIADGAHVPWFALRNYIDCAGPDRCIVVTDAIAAAGMGPGEYTIGEIPVQVGEDAVARFGDTGYLAGSCTTMAASAANLAKFLGLDAPTIRRMCWDNPRGAVGLAEVGS